jgi:hypothetical protein
MLAQAEPESKVPFANRNDRPNNSDGTDSQVAKLKKDLSLALMNENMQSSRINYIKQSRTSRRNVPSAVPRATIHPKVKLGARETVSKLSEPRQQSRNFPRQVHHGSQVNSSEDEEDYTEKNVQANGGHPADLLSNQAILDPRVHGHTSASRDRTRVATNAGCRSANYATDPFEQHTLRQSLHAFDQSTEAIAAGC